MPAIFSKLKFSGSTSGKAIKVGATATPGTLIHTAVSGSVDYDEIWLYVTNNHTANVLVTVEYGGTTSPDNLIQVTVPFKAGLYLLLPGLLLNGGLDVRVFAATTNVICASGFVNRIAAS